MTKICVRTCIVCMTCKIGPFNKINFQYVIYRNWSSEGLQFPSSQGRINLHISLKFPDKRNEIQQSMLASNPKNPDST